MSDIKNQAIEPPAKPEPEEGIRWVAGSWVPQCVICGHTYTDKTKVHECRKEDMEIAESTAIYKPGDVIIYHREKIIFAGYGGATSKRQNLVYEYLGAWQGMWAVGTITQANLRGSTRKVIGHFDMAAANIGALHPEWYLKLLLYGDSYYWEASENPAKELYYSPDGAILIPITLSLGNEKHLDRYIEKHVLEFLLDKEKLPKPQFQAGAEFREKSRVDKVTYTVIDADEGIRTIQGVPCYRCKVVYSTTDGKVYSTGEKLVTEEFIISNISD